MTSVMHPTLYTPATASPDTLLQLLRGKVQYVKRLVICTEDAVSEQDIPSALLNIASVLKAADTQLAIDVFVRARNTEVLEQLLEIPYIGKLKGFVIPKASVKGFPKFADLILNHSDDFTMMPILEDPRMADPYYRTELRSILVQLAYYERIECLRIGGNDLMGHQGIRRDDDEYTIYDTVVGTLIGNIVNEFRGDPHHEASPFVITAPVFECFGPEYDTLFKREARLNILNGMFGQTVIHPRHLELLVEMYKVRPRDLESATEILGSSRAVVGKAGKMDEKTTHSKWAESILQRAELFGVRQQG